MATVPLDGWVSRLPTKPGSKEEKNMKKRYAVQCIKHGHESKDWAGKQVLVSQPHSKKSRLHGGCPYCKKEAIEAAKSHGE